MQQQHFHSIHSYVCLPDFVNTSYTCRKPGRKGAALQMYYIQNMISLFKVSYDVRSTLTDKCFFWK
ncbi:hypothetical protein BD749_0984 [Pontibacter ramchanderi]|uniref:Uncharacterized protein n=1 Tax=Pontibacter ramchanderi TaxID=1179743 RepID=A0A2N3V332_9BACT|nr:hypothetical protein BD749_0984 [Pontibacter ramchanderi]